jgi:C4-dicarboxylate-binding protein DctP
MKKGFVIFLALCLAVPLVFSGGSQEKAEKASGKKIEMKIGHVMAQDSSRHKALVVFQEEVRKKSNGLLDVTIYPAGQLGNESDLIESLKLGTLEGYVGGTFDAQTPKLNLFLMPFTFAAQADLLRVAKGPLAKKIMLDAEKNGIKILSIGDGGSRNITNNIRPIRVPDDLKGIKMRTPPSDAYMKSMEALGANTVTIPYGDVYMALKTGVADGQENPLMNIVTMKFQEVQKYITMVNYIWAPEPFSAGLKWYNGLPSDMKKIVDDGAWLYADTQSRIRAENEDSYLKAIKDAGLEVYVPTSAERQKFITQCASVYEFFIKKGLFSGDELKEFQTAAMNK